MRSPKNHLKLTKQAKTGYTLIEVTLVLAIAGLMLIGVLSGSYAAIATQRYNDSVRGIADFLKSVYDEALAPESFGSIQDGEIGNDQKQAILGKLVEFNANGNIYTATIIGNATTKKTTNGGFLEEFTEQGAADSTDTNASLYCGNASENGATVLEYTPLWGAELLPYSPLKALANAHGLEILQNGRLIGTLVIARTPTSSTLHTIFAPGVVYNISGNCTQASSDFQADLGDQHDDPTTSETFLMTAVGLCVKSDNSKLQREIRIATDGHNSSAVWTRNVDTEEDGDQCNE